MIAFHTLLSTYINEMNHTVPHGQLHWLLWTQDTIQVGSCCSANNLCATFLQNGTAQVSGLSQFLIPKETSSNNDSHSNKIKDNHSSDGETDEVSQEKKKQELKTPVEDADLHPHCVELGGPYKR